MPSMEGRKFDNQDNAANEYAWNLYTRSPIETRVLGLLSSRNSYYKHSKKAK